MCGSLKSKPEDFCICCSVFGTAGGISVASKAKFRDSYPVEQVDSLITRAGTALDREKGSVAGGSLYHTEAVPSGTRFGLEVICDNMNEKEINLLKAGLKSMQDSGLGGFSSRGFGKVKLKITSITKRTAGYYLGQ